MYGDIRTTDIPLTWVTGPDEDVDLPIIAERPGRRLVLPWLHIGARDRSERKGEEPAVLQDGIQLETVRVRVWIRKGDQVPEGGVTSHIAEEDVDAAVRAV